jgi:competence protein ComEC
MMHGVHWKRIKQNAQRWTLALFLIVMISPSSVHAVQSVDAAQLEVHFIDVGQGDAILIMTPDGSTALIDGGLSNGQAMDYLQSLGLDRIDVIIATHPHQDHIAGLVDIMQTFDVGGVWQPGSTNTTLAFERFLTTIVHEGIPFHDAGTGDVIPLGALSLDVLYGVPQAANLNNTSLVLRLTYGDISFLFTGDAERAVEQFLVSANPDRLRSTVLKMGHHGSSTSATPAFVDAVHPQIAVYSAGSGNAYGHPHASPLSNVSAVGATVFGTDVDGTVIITTDGESYRVTTSSDQSIVVGAVESEVESITPEPAPTLRYDPFGRDRNCPAFESQPEAQAFFEAACGPDSDPHGLDGDNDGIVCESLPLIPPGTDRNCPSFATHAEAQAFFEAAGGPQLDPHGLDRDNDGIACE